MSVGTEGEVDAEAIIEDESEPEIELEEEVMSPHELQQARFTITFTTLRCLRTFVCSSSVLQPPFEMNRRITNKPNSILS